MQRRRRELAAATRRGPPPRAGIMASAMRLKHSFGPLAAVESRLNFRNNASLQDSNSNEAHFDDSSSIWDTICPPSTDDPFVKGPPGGVAVPARPRLAVLDNDRRRRGPFGKPFGKPLGQPSGRAATDSPGAADRRNGNRTHGAAFAAGQRNPSDVDGEGSASSSASSCSSASSSGCSSALGSPTAPIQGGIVNPNYPGFEHLAAKLLKLAAGSDAEDSDDDDNNNNNHLTADFNRSYDNNNIEDDLSVNRDSADLKHALLYDKPKLAAAMADATLSSAKEELVLSRDFAKQAKASDPVAPLGLSPLGPLGALAGKMHAAGGGGPRHAPLGHPLGAAPRYKKDSNRTLEEVDEEEEKFSKESTEKEQDTCIVPRKKEKMVMNQQVRKARAGQGHPGFAAFAAAHPDRRLPGHAGHIGPGRRDKRSSLEQLGGFDVYNIETAMPRIDLDLIESHLRAAKEEERRRRNDREEIRRRLAMGSEDADFYAGDQRPGKKPSLQARLQSGMNLQICFMNETLSDTESPSSEAEILSSGASAVPVSSKAPKIEASSERLPGLGTSKPARPLSLPLRLDSHQEWREHSSLMTEADFLARQAQLQTEARMALAQAKDMAHMQMEIERQRQNASPITEMVRHTLKKVGVSFPEDRRRLSRQILTEMNVAQLQVIVNDLHTQIEYLNESLVRFLMERDDLHMEQDSMLVDIEDLTRYLGAKEHTNRGGTNQNNNLFKPNGSSGAGRMNHKK